MRPNTVFSLSISTLMIWFLIAQPGFGVPGLPPDVLELHPGGYVYADYPGVFDNAEGDGITIEAWVYLTERPREADFRNVGLAGGGWVIFAKPGSYFVTVTGKDSAGLESEGTAHIFFGVQRPTDNDVSTDVSTRTIPREEFPIGRRVHVVYQIAVKRDGTHKLSYYDGKNTGIGRPFGSAIGRTAAPLLIGGPKLATLENGWIWGKKNESMIGYIDEVHVSRGWRYAKRGEIHPKRYFLADERTIALWRFEEGPGAPLYSDSSGNGYPLVAGGSLAVHPHGKLTTTWGSLKRRT